MRLSGMTPIERSDALRALAERHGTAMREDAIIVVTGSRVRIRPAINGWAKQMTRDPWYKIVTPRREDGMRSRSRSRRSRSSRACSC